MTDPILSEIESAIDGLAAEIRGRLANKIQGAIADADAALIELSAKLEAVNVGVDYSRELDILKEAIAKLQAIDLNNSPV